MDQINLPTLATISETETTGSFAVEPLYPGYGSTLGNALRRVLLSSLEGAAIDHVTIGGVTHEFSTIPHVSEDVVQLILNLKMVRFNLHADEAELTLNVKGPKVVTAADIDPSASCDVVSKDQHIATLDAGAHLILQLGVKRGRGYEPVEMKKDRLKEVGLIATDSIYSPVVSVSYKVENTRVGNMTNYDRLLVDIRTDGSISPAEGFRRAAEILAEQYAAISGKPVPVIAAPDTHAEEVIVDFDNNELDILQEVDAKTKIEDAGFSTRTAHALMAAGYKTLSGLKRLSDLKLQSIDGLGKKGFEEVKAVLGRVA
jgi:DNA-directed RNA polymerase subunit alpha